MALHPDGGGNSQHLHFMLILIEREWAVLLNKCRVAHVCVSGGN